MKSFNNKLYLKIFLFKIIPEEAYGPSVKKSLNFCSVVSNSLNIITG